MARRPQRRTHPEKLVLDGNFELVDESSLFEQTHEALILLSKVIASQMTVLQSEHDHLRTTIRQEQEQALRLHQEFRRLEKELLSVSCSMPKDEWGLFSGAYTSEKLRLELLGPYWQQIKEICQEGHLLGVKYKYFGLYRPYAQGRHPPYLFFAEPQADYRDEEERGPPNDWQKYLASTKTQRVLDLHYKRQDHLNTVSARVSGVLEKRKLKEVLEARRRDRERMAQERQQRKKDRDDEIRAAAAANTEETRKQAERLRSKLGDQQHCPYCRGQLAGGLHVDHIYPVSKGGRSVVRNLVKVCIECNQKKGNLTLTQFIKAYSLDRDEVERRLAELDKDF